MSSDDASAFYKGRNPSCRGNVLRYNFWSEIGSPIPFDKIGLLTRREVN